MFLSAAIVSFGCLDLLSITLPRNLHELDEIIVITKPEDEETIDYCRSLNNEKITIVTTNAFTWNDSTFNKGLALNVGMFSSKYRQFLATIDSDIILPQGFREKFLALNPSIENGYGMRRRNIETREDFQALEKGIKNKDEFILYRGAFYGYFFMFHYQSSTFQRLLKQYHGLAYPFWIPIANDIDWMFFRNWGEMIYNPSLGKFPECHFESHNDTCSGLMQELPFECLHLGLPGLNHIKRETKLF